ncbi:MAG: hypothetical protein ACE5K8_09120, partial [Candidatus Zixiibacteriota bacterium]
MRLLKCTTKNRSTEKPLAALMVKSKKEFSIPFFSKNLIIIVGGYGSGKSEVAINLARHLATSQAEPVAIAD